ncbi:hypothetical protein KUCAC02_035641, partial [Chaenocephalus aceratus]
MLTVQFSVSIVTRFTLMCPMLSSAQVRMQALTYLQRALLVHDLQTLDATEWESCFNKVFLQHLSPLLSLPTFAALWLTILDFMDKYMHAGSKHAAGDGHSGDLPHSADSRTGYSDLWEITWERIDCFLPLLREELFKQTVIADPGPSPPAEAVQPTPSAGQPSSPRVSQPPSPVPVSPAETRTPSRPESPLEPPAASANGEVVAQVLQVKWCAGPEVKCAQVLQGSGAQVLQGKWCAGPAGEVVRRVGLLLSHPSLHPPMPVPLTTSPPLASSPRSQPPFILQPLASPLQVGVLPMSLPIILNPALIEASSPVPLLPPPRPDEV